MGCALRVCTGGLRDVHYEPFTFANDFKLFAINHKDLKCTIAETLQLFVVVGLKTNQEK